MTSTACRLLVVVLAAPLLQLSAGAQASRPAVGAPTGKAVPRGTASGSPQAPAPSPTPSPAPPSATPTASALFDPGVVHDVYLTVNTRDWVQLKEDYRADTYYLADLRWRNEVVRNVGIRSRGNGSRSGVKPGLRVDFNRYAAEGEFLGLKSVVLDNLLQDPTMMRERLAMALFAELGIPAPREAHARLFVNNEYVGLYALVEAVDKRFLSRAFDENDGYLYEYKWLEPYRFEFLGEELEPYARYFEPRTHESKSMFDLYRPVRDMVYAFSQSPEHLFAQAASSYVDLRAAMTYVAVENFVAEEDGVLGRWGLNNFYLYRFEKSTRHQFIPWDKDRAFRAIDHDIWYNTDRDAFVSRAMRDPALRQAYIDALRRSAELALRPTASGQGGTTGWMERQVAVIAAQIRGAAEADRLKPYTNDDVAAGAAGLQEFARERPGFVLRALGANQ